MQKQKPKSKIFNIFNQFQQKMQSRKFVIHPLFLIVGIVMFLLGQGFMFVCYTLCVFLHELSHMVVAKKLGYVCNRIKLMPFGAVLEAESDEFCPKDEILIAVAGPLCNLLLSLICVTFWWISPETYHLTCDFAVANLVCGVFNLLPIFPLDGGRVLLAIISINHDRKLSVKVVKVITIVFGFILFFIFIISLAVCPNFSIGVMGFTLIVSAFSEDKKTTYKRIIGASIKRKKLKHGLQTRAIMVSQDLTLGEAYSKLSFNHFNFIYVCNDDFEILKIITESQLSYLLNKYGSTEKLANL